MVMQTKHVYRGCSQISSPGPENTRDCLEKLSHALEAARSWFNDLHCSSWVLEGWTHLTVEECEPPKAEIPRSRKLLQV